MHLEVDMGAYGAFETSASIALVIMTASLLCRLFSSVSLMCLYRECRFCGALHIHGWQRGTHGIASASCQQNLDVCCQHGGREGTE